MGRYLFTVPMRFRSEAHPLGIGPDDLFIVDDTSEAAARYRINQTLGNHVWCSTVPADREAEVATLRTKWATGRIVDLDGNEVEL